MLKLLFPNREPGERLFSHSSGDFGVIIIALIFTFGAVYLCFVKFNVPPGPVPAPVKPSSEVSVGIVPSHK